MNLSKILKLFKKNSDKEIELYKSPELKKLSQEEIDKIHKEGYITQAEAIDEWNDIGLCAPGDALGSATWRCHKFHQCNDCLVDYASSQDKWPSLFKNFKLIKYDLSSEIYQGYSNFISQTDNSDVKEVTSLWDDPSKLFCGKESVPEITQERINEIYKNGNNTAKEQVDEWESLGLCAPSNAARQEVDRCKDYRNCHECLVDFASQQDEWVSVYRIASLLGEQPMYNPNDVLKIKVKKKD